MTEKPWEKCKGMSGKFITYLTSGSLIVSSATSWSFKDAGGGCSKKKTTTYIVEKNGRHKK